MPHTFDDKRTRKRRSELSLSGYTAFITGGSRGIGLAIGRSLAAVGCNVALVAKTAEPHPHLPGTVFTAAQEVEKVIQETQSGARVIPIVCDIRSEEQVQAAVQKTLEAFKSIDILINNASAIWLKGTLETSPKRYDLMHSINTRGTYVCSHLILPHLLDSAKRGKRPHILNLSPPLSLNPIWFQGHTAYTIAKYGMSLCALGMSAEFPEVSINCLWPRTAIQTAAVKNMGEDVMKNSRTPDIMADAALLILTGRTTGKFYVDEDVMRAMGGMTDFSEYSSVPESELVPDFFLDEFLTPEKLNPNAGQRAKL